ncbi:MAG: 3-phosphoshikimate 1-carboxyvinyltransferase [Alphaproteobacteria bacterium]|tara:strand:+ start:5245 stop:6555 length:1311 start_codon:yes stop_codon:yes gene_type:complete
MKYSFTLKSYKSKCLEGNLTVPADKSISIRALILASYCVGSCKIFNLLESDDVLNTLKVIKKLGVKIEKKKKYYLIHGNGGYYEEPQTELYFGNSGTGVRLLTGLLSSNNLNATLTGDSSLSSRPMLRIIKPLEKMNLIFEHNNGFLPIKIKKNNNYTLPCNYKLTSGSAQVKSAILLASLGAAGKTTILEKIGSRDHTEIMLKYLGAKININSEKISLESPNFLKPKDIHIPGDFSSASFLIVAGLIIFQSKIIIKDVGLNYFRIGLIDVLIKMDAKIKITNKRKLNGEDIGDIEVSSSKLKGVNFTGKISPRMIDEYPIVFVAASFASGTSIFKGLGELKVKESNRLKVMYETLKLLGVKIKMGDSHIEITGDKNYNCDAKIKTFDDHRIAMSSLVFGMASNGSVEIDDMSMINTSFPNFKKTFEELGAKIKFI